MPRPNPENIKRAIEDVQQSFDELQAKWHAKLKEADEIKESLGKLEAFLNPAKALLSMGGDSQAEAVALPKATPLPLPSSIPPMSLIEKPLLVGGIEILFEAGRPMHLNEIEAEFRRRRWKLSEKNGKEVLRVTFKKHIGSILVKSKKGLYDVKDRSALSGPQPLIRRAYPKPIETEAPKEK